MEVVSVTGKVSPVRDLIVGERVSILGLIERKFPGLKVGRSCVARKIKWCVFPLHMGPRNTLRDIIRGFGEDWGNDKNLPFVVSVIEVGS